MKSSFTIFASIAALATLAGCTSLQSVSITQIPGDRSRPLHAEVSNTALLGIHFSNDFIEPLTGDYCVYDEAPAPPSEATAMQETH